MKAETVHVNENEFAAQNEIAVAHYNNQDCQTQSQEELRQELRFESQAESVRLTQRRI
jgi:hypothetical protein